MQMSQTNKSDFFLYLFKIILVDICPFLWGHCYPCFGLLVISSLDFKARVDSFTSMLHCLCAMDFTESSLVQHLLTSWQQALSYSNPRSCAQALVGLESCMAGVQNQERSKIIKGPFTPKESESESENDKRTGKKLFAPRPEEKAKKGERVVSLVSHD